MARVWLVRLGKFGEAEGRALADKELATGWEIADLTAAQSRAEIFKLVEAAYPAEKAGTLQNWAVQLNQLRNEMVAGDLVVIPLKTSHEIAIGKVVGDYIHLDGKHPSRRVEWLVTDLPRESVKQDLLFSLGASQTVCEISRNEAAARFAALAATRKDPGQALKAPQISKSAVGDAFQTADEAVDLADAARDQIERFIATKFTGHAFTELVAAILRAQGYQTRVSPPGADRGVDIVAGQGALGFEGPRLVVQVKSGGTVVDQPTLQSLLGCIQDTQADHGMVVSWSGFKAPVRQRANELYFRVRFWGREEVLDALFSVYERLPEELRAELPLRRLWTLVPE